MNLDDFPRVPLLFGPSPVHPLPRLTAALGGPVEIWAKREDCNSGIAFGGNKVRKLEYLAADALATGCDTLVSIGGMQSNHTRAVTGVARHLGLDVVTVQEHWVDWDDPGQPEALARIAPTIRPPLTALSRATEEPATGTDSAA